MLSQHTWPPAGRQATHPLSAAEAYLELGWSVILLHQPTAGGGCTCGADHTTEPARRGKHPRHAWREFQRRRMTRHELHALWPKSRSPGYATLRRDVNVGIVTGAVSGLAVLDVDARNGGDETLRDLTAKHGPIPDTATVLTGGGGEHLYFRLPGGVALRSCVLGPGLELKAEGSYVVAPPSLHAWGRQYDWELGRDPRTLPPAPLPDWLLRLATDETGRPRPEGQRGALLQGRTVPQGDRHREFLNAAAVFAARGMPADLALELLRILRERLADRGDHPVTERELEGLVRWAYAQERRRSQQDAAAVRPEIVLVPAAEVGQPAPVAWLWEGEIPLEPGTVVMVCAPGGAGKTVFCRGLATAIAQGQPFLGSRTRQVPVLYADLESPESAHRRLLDQMGRPSGLYLLRQLSLRTEDERAELAKVLKGERHPGGLH